MKRDGFGIGHRAHCEVPRWRVVQVSRRGGGLMPVQQCGSCGVLWRVGDPSGPAQSRVGYPLGRRSTSRDWEVVGR